ncbi:MAG: lipopolysaccharide biosynthesis protein [Pseudomonadota bacterium]
MSLKDKTHQGLLWSAVQAWGGKAVSLLVFFVLARMLSPEAFGLVALAATVVAVMQLLLEQGFAQALIQRENLDPEHKDTAFWTTLGTGLFLTALGWATAGPIAAAFGQPDLAPVLVALSALFVLNALSSVQATLLERDFQFKALTLRSLAGLVAGGVAGIGAALAGFGVWALVAQQLVQELVSTIVLWRASAWRPKFRFSGRHFSDLVRFGASLFALNFVHSAKDESTPLLIGYFLGPATLGLFTVAERIADAVMHMVVAASAPVALPVFSRLQTDLERMRRVFYQATQLSVCAAFPVFAGLALLAPELVAVVLGAQWAGVAPVLQVLALAGLVDSTAFFRGHVITAMGKPTWRLRQGLLSTALHFAFFAIAFRWGVVAIAWAFLARRVVIVPYSLWTVRQLIGFSWTTYLQQLAGPFVAVAIMAAAVWGTRGLLYSWSAPQAAVIAACAAAGAIIYIGALRIIAPELFRRMVELALSLARPILPPHKTRPASTDEN